MKKRLALENSFQLLMIAFLFASCQKGGSDISAPKMGADPGVVTTAVVPEKVCADKILKAQSRLKESADKNKEIYSALSANKEDVQLKAEMRSSTLQKVASCKLISKLFRQDDTSACLKSETPKTIDNVLFRDAIESSCKPALDWFAKSNASPSELSLTPADKKTPHYNFHFNESAHDLIQRKNSNSFIYLSQGQIKNGQDLFQSDTLAGAVTCSFFAPSDTITHELNFKVISEMPENSTDLNFPFSGNFLSLALEDSSQSILSLTCLNMKKELTPEKMTALQTIFGKLITINNSDSNDIKNLNTPLDTPSNLLTGTTSDFSKNKVKSSDNPLAEIKIAAESGKKEENKTLPAKKNNADSVIDTVITRTKETISDVVKEAVSQVKTAADETRSTTIKEVSKATREVSKEFIADAKAAAKEVVSETIQSAQTAAIKTAEAPFIYLNDKALEVKTEIKGKAIQVITFVKEKSLQIKDTVTTAATDEIESIKKKAISAKSTVINSLKSSSDYWKNLF